MHKTDVLRFLRKQPIALFLLYEIVKDRPNSPNPFHCLVWIYGPFLFLLFSGGVVEWLSWAIRYLKTPIIYLFNKKKSKYFVYCKNYNQFITRKVLTKSYRGPFRTIRLTKPFNVSSNGFRPIIMSGYFAVSHVSYLHFLPYYCKSCIFIIFTSVSDNSRDTSRNKIK